MDITKEQVQQYIRENFDSFFVEALAKYVKDTLMGEEFTKSDLENYREELKQLIWEAVSHGVKEYLEEYDNEHLEIIASKFAEEVSKRRISIEIK